MIMRFLCCEFYQSTFPPALIVSREVMHAVGRVRSQFRNENNDQISPPSKHHHILHSNTPTARYSRQVRTREDLRRKMSHALPQGRSPLKTLVCGNQKRTAFAIRGAKIRLL